jgi:hypothetical protein
MKRLFLVAAAAAALGLAACATPTPYQPYTAAGSASGGYSETRIASDRFRVTFQGNTVTERDQVERYLLYRAAELTIAEGYDWFSLADRNTERQARSYVVDHDPFGYDYWQPSWYYVVRGGRVYRIYDPFPPFPRSSFGRYDVQQIDQYRASAEILLGHGAKPADDRSAFDARDVIANLGPSIVRPSS